MSINFDPFAIDAYYHYCTNQTFLTIIRDRTILFSDLKLSNDTMEGAWVSKILKGMIMADTALRPYADQIVFEVDWIAKYYGALGFCMSKDGDMLSQWRGYADDGKGFSIGFYKKFCKNSENFRSVDLVIDGVTEVEYDSIKQEQLLQELIDKLRPHVEAGAFRRARRGGLMDNRTEVEIKADSEIYEREKVKALLVIRSLIGEIFRFKNPAFMEEKEMRMLYHKRPNSELQFIAKSDRIVPCKIFHLNEEHGPAIGHVVIGPRNVTSKETVKLALETYGWTSVTVSESSATYR